MTRIIDDEGFSPTRRRILAGSTAWAAASAGAFAFNLSTIGAAAAANLPRVVAAEDYRALVCLFLFGGNDSGNTLIPFDSVEYGRYVVAREGSASRPYGTTRLRSDLLPLNAASLTDGRQMGLPREMSALKTLYDEGKAAIVANVGLLNAPITRTQYDNGSVSVPPQLFSHSDQLTFWQASTPSYASSTGWGGRIVDVVASANAGGRLSSAISVNGNNLWQVGNATIPFPIDAEAGADSLHTMEDAGYAKAFRAMLDASRSNLLEQEAVRVYRRSISGERAVSEAFAATTALTARFPRRAPADVPNPASGWHDDLMRQLAGISRMIAAAPALGLKRQVFFAGIGGFDMHNTLEHHRFALQAISDGLFAFQRTMESLNLGRSVTAFTASDFGRPLQVNGTGSDHGWGAHHLVVGGAVRGGNIYGRVPGFDTRGGSEYTGAQGHLIPTTSVEQYAGAMARWMGVPDSDLATVLPNINRFGPTLAMF